MNINANYKQNIFMKYFLLTLFILGISGIIFSLPLTINSFTSESPLYQEDKQKIINNEYEEEDSADFGFIKKENELKNTKIWA